MADPVPSVPFDTAAARADGVSDADIAAFLAPKLGFDLGAARKDGVSDSAIVDFLAPPAPVKAAAVPEPESGTLKGIGKAAAQTVGEIPGNVVRGFGAGVASAGTGLLELDKRDTDATRQRIDLMDKIDSGETVKPIKAEGLAAPSDPQFEFAMKYMAAGEKGRGELRQKTINDIAERQIEPGAERRLGQSAKKVGSEIFGTGQAMNKAVQAAIPLAPEEEQRPSVQFTRALTGLVAYVGAGAVGGLPGVIGYAGMDAMGHTYEEAKAKGASDEDAAAAGMLNGLVQGGLMTVPVGHALKVMDRLSSAAKGQFVKGVVESAKSGATLTAFAQIAQIADNAVAKSTHDPDRSLTHRLGEHLGPTFAAGAVLPVAGVAAARAANRFRAKPEDAARKVMDSGTVDEAIDTAKSVAEGTPVDVDAVAAQAREYGGPPEQQQGKLLQLFGGLNRGTVEQAADGAFHFRAGEGETETTTPLRVWDEKAQRAEGAESTIAPALAAAQRDHYGKLGVDIVYFENDTKIPFDGAMDPQNPNTIFLSNHPERNAAQVAAHEVTHVLESTTLPDGTNLGDVLHRQIREGITAEGLRHANEMFGKTAPKREAFPEGPEGAAAHSDAVVSHIIRELGADIGGEAPRFQTFVPKVVEAVQQRYGVDAAKDVLGKLIAGIQQAMRTLREFFAKPEEHAEYGQPETVSQNWVTNLGEVHDTLAKMYAERFGTQAEKENSALATMRDKAQRDRFARENPEPGAPEVPPPSMPEGFLEPAKPESITPDAQRPATEEAHQRIVRMRRWLGELDDQRRAQAAASPQATFLRQTEAAILAKVRGVEDRLTGAQASRLEKVRAELDMLLNPTGDSPDMARVRQALGGEQQKLADAAAVGSSAAPIGGRSGIRPRAARQEVQRIQAVPQEAPVERAAEPTPAAEPILEPAQAAEPPAEAAPVVERPLEPAAAQPTEAPLSEAGRERLMREQAAEQIRWAVEEGGIPPEAVPQIAHLYRLDAGEDPSVAFHRAVDQWITLEEARAVRATTGDARALEEPYTEPQRTDHADTLRREPTGTPEAARDEAAAPAPERPARDEAGGEPPGGGRVPGEAAPEASLSPKDEGPRFSPKLTGESKERSYTPEERKAYENVGRAVEPFSLGKWLGETRQDLGKKLIAAALDPYIGVKENDPQGYLALRNANTSGGAVEVFKKYGTLKFDGNAYALDKRTGGVTELVKPLHAEAHDFLWWVAANRAERLAKEDRENLWTPEDIAVIKKTNRGNVEFDYELPNGKITRSREAIYADSLRKLDTLNRNVMDLAVEAGLLKRDAVNALWSNPFYVPFYRQAEDNGRFVGPSISSGFVKQNAFKTLKGGSEKLNNDLWENALGNWQHMIDASISNRASLGVLDVASTNAAGARPMTLQEVNHLSDKELKSRTVWVMKDGEKVHYEITDPLLFKAVSALDSLADPMHLMSMGRWFKRVLQVGVTSNPAFAVRNLIRDTQQTLAVAPSSFNIANTMVEGFRMNDAKGALANLARAAAAREVRTLDLSDEAVNAIAGGATMRLVESTDTGVRDTKLRTMLDTPASVEGFWNYLSTLGRAYKEVAGQGEDVNRLALYHKLRAEGVPHDAAVLAARDLGDFTLSGASTVVRYIIGVVPFLNARMQGLYKVGRSAVNADRAFSAEVGLPDRSSSGRLAVVLGTSALAMLALDSIYANDEDYKKRTEFDRNTYYWFKFGDAQIRIPMGFEIAALARMAANTAESFYDKEMTVGRLFQSYWQMLGQNLQMNPIPQVFAPLEDLRTNTSGTGQHIVPMGMEHLQPDQRYTANNTLAARGVSTAINSTLRAIPGVHAEGPSPIQLDYLVKAYGGWLATSSLGMADTVMRSFTSEPVRPAKDFWATATQGMVSTESSPQSRYVDMLYTQGKEIEQAYATYRDMIQRGQAEEAQRFFKDNRETLQKHGLISGLTRLEGDLNRQIRYVTNNPDPKVTAEQKKIQIMQLQAMKSRAAEQVFEARPARGE